MQYGAHAAWDVTVWAGGVGGVGGVGEPLESRWSVADFR